MTAQVATLIVIGGVALYAVAPARRRRRLSRRAKRRVKRTTGRLVRTHAVGPVRDRAAGLASRRLGPTTTMTVESTRNGHKIKAVHPSHGERTIKVRRLKRERDHTRRRAAQVALAEACPKDSSIYVHARAGRSGTFTADVDNHERQNVAKLVKRSTRATFRQLDREARRRER